MYDLYIHIFTNMYNHINNIYIYIYILDLILRIGGANSLLSVILLTI